MPKRRELQQEKICKVIKITAVKERADKWHTVKNPRRVWLRCTEKLKRGRDECADLREIAAGLLPLDKQIQIEKNVFENYPMLVRDRVELSEEYLAVIDEVERLLEEECGENAHPLETAQAKARLLSERGILWRSEMQLNPGVLFD